MKKLLAKIALLATVAAPFTVPFLSSAATTWDTTGNYVIAFEYGGADYQHDVHLVQDGSGNLTGNGGSPAGANTYTWVITSGTVADNTIDFLANYTATPDAVSPQTIMHVIGTIASNGTISGTWSDNYAGGSRSGTFTTTSGAANLMVTNTNVVVSENTAAGENQPGWLFNRDATTSTPYTFNNDFSSVGSGSLYILPIGGSTSTDKFIAENFLNAPIANVDSISYDFRIGSTSLDTQAGQFYMNVYANFGVSADDKFYDCRYDVVPTMGSTTDWTTVTFDPTQSYSVTQRGGANASPFACPSVPADMDLVSAGSNIRAFAINVGDSSLSDAGLSGYLDKVVVLMGTNQTTYDFDPAPIVLPGSLAAEDFGVVNYDTGLGILKGYTAGFGLTDATLADATSVVVKLYAAGDVLLQTNTANIAAFNLLPGTQFSSPFDVSGTFDYATDGYWTNVRETQYGQSVPAVKVVAEVTLANGKVVTATNTNLTGDPSTIFVVVPPVTTPTNKDQCKGEGWKSFSNPTFKNQGQCVSYVTSHQQAH